MIEEKREREYERGRGVEASRGSSGKRRKVLLFEEVKQRNFLFSTLPRSVFAKAYVFGERKREASHLTKIPFPKNLLCIHPPRGFVSRVLVKIPRKSPNPFKIVEQC